MSKSNKVSQKSPKPHSARKPGQAAPKTEKIAPEVQAGLLAGPAEVAAPVTAAPAAAATPPVVVPQSEGLQVDAVVQMLVGLGLSLEEKKGYWKLTGKSGARLYVAKTKTRLTRVDVSGVQNLGMEGLAEFVYGNVRYQLDAADRSDEQVLATLRALAAVLDTPAEELQAAGRLVPGRAAKTGPAPTPGTGKRGSRGKGAAVAPEAGK